MLLNLCRSANLFFICGFIPALAVNEPEGILTLDSAFAITLLQNPELAGSALEIRIQESTRLQAGLGNNPELSLDIEDFGISGSQAGFGKSQTTLQIGQRFELGGKRAARMKTASLGAEKAGWEYEAKKLAVFNKVSHGYLDIVLAQRDLVLAEEALRLADQVAEAVNLRGRAGRASVVEEAKAKVGSANARIELEWSKNRLEESRKSLAALWGSTGPRFLSAKDQLDSAVLPPPFEALISHLEGHPDLARYAAEIAQNRSALDLEKANRLPDLTVSGGYRRITDPGTDAFVAGVSMPLLFLNGGGGGSGSGRGNMNQGRILEAGHRITQTEKKLNAAELELKSRLSAACRTASTAHAEIEILNASVLPSVKTAFESATEGFRQGRYGFLEVLDAQKNLAASRSQHLRAVADFNRALIEIKAITEFPVMRKSASLERNR